jgi:hypothetical protein
MGIRFSVVRPALPNALGARSDAGSGRWLTSRTLLARGDRGVTERNPYSGVRIYRW